MPGTWASIAYLTAPVTLSGTSTRGTSLPMKRKFAAGLRSPSSIFGSSGGALAKAGVRAFGDAAPRPGRNLGRRSPPFRRDRVYKDTPRLGAGQPHRLEVSA